MDRIDCDRMMIAVVETGSFVNAAKRLGTSPAQASKLIARLEEILNVRLFNRNTRTVAPTDVGRAYYGRIHHIVEEMDVLDAEIGMASRIPTGRLRLTAPASFGRTQLMPILLDFARMYPGIELDVNFSDRAIHLVEEGFDAAIRAGRITDANLVGRRLCHIWTVVAGAPAYFERKGVPAHPRDLTGHDCIIDTNFSEPLRWKFQDPATKKPFQVDVSGRLSLSSAEGSLTAALGGFGLARLPSFIGASQFKAGRLIPLFREFDPGPVDVQILYPPGRHLAQKVRAFVDFAAARFKDAPNWDNGW